MFLSIDLVGQGHLVNYELNVYVDREREEINPSRGVTNSKVVKTCRKINIRMCNL